MAPVGGNEKVGLPIEGTGHVQGVHGAKRMAFNEVDGPVDDGDRD